MSSRLLAVLAALAVVAPASGRGQALPAGPQHQVPLGFSVNVFDRYGQMALLFKMLPLEQETKPLPAQKRHLYLGPASPVLARRASRPEVRPMGGEFRRWPRFDFCRSSRELLAALFSEWWIDGTGEPQKALIAGTPPKWIAERLGINAMYLNSSFYYVLVRLERPVRRASLAGAPAASQRFRRRAGAGRDPASAAQDLIDEFGTHYFSGFHLGDVVYQVYAYNPQTSANLEQLFATYEAGGRRLDGSNQLFSPWYASHIGRVTLASAPLEFRLLVGPRLSRRIWFRPFQSLFLLLEHDELLTATHQLSEVMVTGVRLRGLQHLIANDTVRRRFEEIVSNRFLLWDHNL